MGDNLSWGKSFSRLFLRLLAFFKTRPNCESITELRGHSSLNN